jgi:hypothetical protein
VADANGIEVSQGKARANSNVMRVKLKPLIRTFRTIALALHGLTLPADGFWMHGSLPAAVDHLTPNCFIVRDTGGQQFAYVYFDDPREQ